MIRVFISPFCIVLLGVLLPIVAVDAQRDEATVAANWTFPVNSRCGLMEN